MSDGDNISYGFHEKDDLDCVVKNLKQLKYISKICIWGRSMGAHTILQYILNTSEKISSIVVDSVYLNFRQVI